MPCCGWARHLSVTSGKAIRRKGLTLKHALLFLFAFSVAVATAQQADPPALRNQVALLEVPPLADTAAVESPQAGTSTPSPKPATKEKTQPKPTTPTEPTWPSGDPSDVGYIDNAVVSSEVRIRFDAAFNDQFPDRAEFIYGKCGCYANPFLVPPTSSAYDANAPGPGPGIPNNVNFQSLSFMGEYAPKGNHRFSAFFQLPFRWLQPQGLKAAGTPNATVAFSNGAGISDVEFGLKFALLASPKRYLTAQLKTYFPSGSARHGLGSNHYSLEPALLYYQRFSHKFQLEGELGGWLPIGGSAGVSTTLGVPSPQGFAGNIFFYGIGPSYRIIDHDQFKLAPVIELVGWTVTGGFQTGPASASGTNIVNLKVGARMSFHSRNSVYVGYGFPLTSADWYNDILRVEYRYSF